MKKLILIFSISTLTTSCISTKSTIKNIDNSAIRPQIKDGHFIFTEYATDSKYGTDADYPVNIGIISDRSEDVFINYFFNGLQGPNGEKVIFKKTDTCCPFPTKHSNMGAGLLYMYEVNLEGSTKKKSFISIFMKKEKLFVQKVFKSEKID